MFLAHSIRLRDPWQCEPAENGGLRWSRVFHRPTGLEEDDQLVLVICGLPHSAEVTINGHAFPPAPDSNELAEVSPHPPAPFQYDVTSILADDNRVELITPPGEPAAATGPSTLASFPYDARLAIVGHS